MELIYLGLHNISSERVGYSGTGTPAGCGAQYTCPAVSEPTSIVLESNSESIIFDLHRNRDRFTFQVIN
jgi:hypothetical protein